MHHQVVILEVDRYAQALTLQRVRKRRVDVEIQRVAVLVPLARRLGLDARRQVLRIVRAKARFADAPQQMLQGAIAKKIDPFIREIELHLLRGFLGHAARTEHGLLRTGHLRGLLQIQIALLDQLLHDLIEQLRQLALQLRVLLGVTGRVATQDVEHVLGQLARIHQCLENRLAQRVE